MSKPRRILVALKRPEEVVPLTDLACRLGAHGATIFLVHVVELPEITPLNAEVPALDAAGERLLADAARLARPTGMTVSKLLLRAHSAPRALLEEIEENDIELLILGSHRRRSFREVLLGTTHDFLVRRAPCQVLLAVPPHPARLRRAPARAA
jgi:nucleotide-binding universal stress UspA family protein